MQGKPNDKAGRHKNEFLTKDRCKQNRENPRPDCETQSEKNTLSKPPELDRQGRGLKISNIEKIYRGETYGPDQEPNRATGQRNEDAKNKRQEPPHSDVCRITRIRVKQDRKFSVYV